MGGEVFRRNIEGQDYRFELGGLWGSGNTLTERELLYTLDNTIYEMWTGTGILGPREGLVLDRFDALWGRILWGEFLDRYAYLPSDSCRVFLGEEILGIGCDEACATVEAVCEGTMMAESCSALCEELPRSVTTCLANLGETCDLEACNLREP